MKIDIDFFKTTFAALEKRVAAASKTGRRTARIEVSKYRLLFVETSSKFREKNFLKDLLTKSAAQGKSKCSDLLFWLRENVFLKDARIFLKDTYARIVVRHQYTQRDLVVFFIVAFILGAGLKSIATSTITIGFDDYTLIQEESLYDLNALSQKLIDEGGVLAGSGVAEGDTCSE